ncbi:thioesterase II family protein [Dactylosporangium darangshiense]|uniref:Alpha/beta fold hydrolase n=1 Tax=Dactylosporangium darangshiense TaxID=579108 RepID=A0ABP8DF09_9ACTN
MSGYLTREPGPGDALRLFCFHHAGGAASVYSPWPARLAPAVTVLPVQLPGRETRRREPRLRDMATLVERLEEHLDPFLDRPFAFYGHSMGALVALRMTLQRYRMSRTTPVQLLVAAFPAPHLPQAAVPPADIPDDDLLRWMTGIGGISPALLRYPEWVRTATDLVRDDLALCRSGRLAAPVSLPCFVHAFYGTTDPLMSPQSALAWRPYGGAGFAVHPVPGGHLFHHESAAALLPRLHALLSTSPELLRL